LVLDPERALASRTGIKQQNSAFERRQWWGPSLKNSNYRGWYYSIPLSCYAGII